MIRRQFKGKFFFFIVFFLFFFALSALEERISEAAIRQNHSIVAKKTKARKIKTKKKKKNKKEEVIHSKKQLIKSINKHLLKFSTKINFKISKKVVKKFSTFDQIFWSTQNKEFLPSAILSQLEYLNSEYSDTGKFFFIRLDLKYKGSKEELKKFVEDMRTLNAAPILSTREEVRESFFQNYHRLEPAFSLKLSADVAKQYQEDPYFFLTSLEDDPRYNDLKWDMPVNGEFKEYPSFSVFRFWSKFEKSQEELNEILRLITPILTTKEEVFAEILAKADQLEGNYSLNIKNDALPYQIGDGNEIWEELYGIPEYNDLSRYNETGNYEIEEFISYYKLTMEDRYSLRKEELDGLKKFVVDWVAVNIRPEMTQEEKARTINDFMVKEYRYTYGDRGELFGTEKGSEKLGNYSVYTCFSLIHGKGGVCDAKAKLFYRLAKEAGLEVLYVTGTGNGGAHAWNLVKIDGNWYHLNNTWNRGYYEGSSEYEFFNSRDYYLKGDSTMRRDHSWDETKYPIAPMDYQGYVPTASIEAYLSFGKAA